MNKKSLYVLILAVLSSLIFTTCKKGPNDPEISFRTRKARLVGEWRMKSGNASITITNPTQAPYNEGYLFDGTNVTLNVTESGNVGLVYTGAYLLDIAIKKDGTFTLNENIGGKVLLATGKWNFLGRVGKAKNKENIVLTIESVTGGVTSQHIFSKYGTEFVYSINELRNKEMRLESATKIYVDTKGDQVSYKSEYNFIQ